MPWFFPGLTWVTNGLVCFSGSLLSSSWTWCWSPQRTRYLPWPPAVWLSGTYLGKPWGSSLLASSPKPMHGPCPPWLPLASRLLDVLGLPEPLLITPHRQGRLQQAEEVGFFYIKTSKHQTGSEENTTLYYPSHTWDFLIPHNPMPCTKLKINSKKPATKQNKTITKNTPGWKKNSSLGDISNFSYNPVFCLFWSNSLKKFFKSSFYFIMFHFYSYNSTETTLANGTNDF